MSDPFRPESNLLPGRPLASCRAIVIIPARNEAESLPQALNALAGQVDKDGYSLAPSSFEVLLLLNNCTDGSRESAQAWHRTHPQIQLHILHCSLSREVAHVGTVRRMLMNTAYQRLSSLRLPDSIPQAILSTDADTVVAPDWIFRNLDAISAGADAVGGWITLLPPDLEALDPGTRSAYQADRRHQLLSAHLESLLDPEPCDPWPRHLDHFGASLACTPQVYARAGGLPAVRPLEDVAFVDALRRIDARIRHAQEVHVYTSARLQGRAEVGLSGQLRIWHDDHLSGRPQIAETAEWLEHRFSTLGRLRRICRASHAGSLAEFPADWRDRIAEAHRRHLTVGQFLGEIDCNGLIESTFTGQQHGPIGDVLLEMEVAIRLHDEQQSSAKETSPNTITGDTTSQKQDLFVPTG